MNSSIKYATTIPGWMTEPELLTLYHLASTANNWLEIGAWCGRSTYAVAMGLPPYANLHIVDPWKDFPSFYNDFLHVEPKERFNTTLNKIKINRPDLTIQVHEMTSLEANQVIEGCFDVIFIDADHSYNQVTQDCLMWESCTRFLCGHDYDSEKGPEVMQAVDNLYNNRIAVFVNTSIWGVRVTS